MSVGDPTSRPVVLRILILLLAASLLGTPAWGTTVLRVDDLQQLAEESRCALLARVVGVRYGLDERGLHGTWVTVEVEDRLYGQHLPQPGGLHTIKLFGSPVPAPDGSRLFVDGTPRYKKGDRVFLLLIEVSPWGFTQTAGLFQGAFRVTKGVDGRLMAESLAGNHAVLGDRGLERWLSEDEVGAAERAYLTATQGPVPYALLRRAVARAKGTQPPPFDLDAILPQPITPAGGPGR